MALEIIGSLNKILPEQTGVGRSGSWVKQNFIIETDDQYPKKICICAWGDKADEIKKYRMGDRLKISIDLESREYQEKWYTDIKAWRIEKIGAESPRGAEPAQSPPGGFDERDYSKAVADVSADDLPF